MAEAKSCVTSLEESKDFYRLFMVKLYEHRIASIQTEAAFR